jgi:hypothetical protein
VGVRNDVIIWKVFLHFIKTLTIAAKEEKYQNVWNYELHQTQSYKNFKKLIWEIWYDVIHDAPNVIFSENFQHPRNFGDIAFFVI